VKVGRKWMITERASPIRERNGTRQLSQVTKKEETRRKQKLELVLKDREYLGFPESQNRLLDLR
jgi:hypothetical protein